VTAAFLARGALLLMDKPAGMTSHDVVERVRRTTRVPRIGHTGTLDPMATGLLLLCCGRAARLQGFFTGLPKCYEGTIALGRATDTYDREGAVTREHDGEPAVSPDELEAAAARFRGEFDQAPPPYSAKKVGGRKLYELARRGQEIPSVPKRVHVTSFLVERISIREIRFRLDCSSGTYVRSIAHDLGGALGCGAHLSELRRTRIGDFSVSDAIPLADFETASESERVRAPHAIGLAQIPFPFPRMTVAAMEARKIRQGQPVPARVSAAAGSWVSVLGDEGEILALGQVTPIGTGRISMVKPRIVLAE